jgi:hypothetical protein
MPEPVSLVDPQLRAGKLLLWLGAVEENGMPSSSRIHMIWWSGVCTVIAAAVFWHMIHLSDTVRLGMWLSNLPILTLCLTALMQSGYLINQGSGVFGLLADAWGKSKGQDSAKPSDANLQRPA